MNLPSPKTIKDKIRRGRGMGSKGGHTVGRGQKGQKSRSGYKSPRPGFEGGRMPLSRRIPKLKGFRRSYQSKLKKVIIVNISDLDKLFEKDSKVNFETLTEKGIKSSNTKKNIIKILGKGETNKKFDLEGLIVSKTAKIKIEKAGGSVK